LDKTNFPGIMRHPAQVNNNLGLTNSLYRWLQPI
jgi:hypothetical protein